MFLQHVIEFLPHYTASHPRRQYFMFIFYSIPIYLQSTVYARDWSIQQDVLIQFWNVMYQSVFTWMSYHWFCWVSWYRKFTLIQVQLKYKSPWFQNRELPQSGQFLRKTNYTEHSSAGQECLSILWNSRFITMFTRAHRLLVSWFEYNPHIPIYA
jgi:hypothetical protein